MTKNIGKTDKILRLVVGSVILAVGFIFESWWGALGLIPIVTALVGTCPLYFFLGINTCSTASSDQQPPASPGA